MVQDGISRNPKGLLQNPVVSPKFMLFPRYIVGAGLVGL